jgi:hypothetical protein
VADAPWRCSECGTVNEPVANACRTCGRWPSLFDLEESKVDGFEDEFPVTDEPAMEDFEVASYEELPAEPIEPGAPTAPPESESSNARRRRIFRSVILPLAVVIYLVITFIVNR